MYLSSLWHWVLWETRQQEPCSPGTHISMEETNQVRLHIHRGHSNLPSGERWEDEGGGCFSHASQTICGEGLEFLPVQPKPICCSNGLDLCTTWDPPLELVNTWVFYSTLGDQSIPWPCCSNVKLQPKFLNLYSQWLTSREEYEIEADLEKFPCCRYWLWGA